MDMLANYRKEREAFKNLLRHDNTHRVLLLRGESGMGKTTLLRAFEELLDSDNVCYVPFDCKDIITLEEVFYRIGSFLNWQTLPHLTECISALENPEVHVTMNHNWLVGIRNHLKIVLENTQRQDHSVQLVDALTEDLKKLQRSLLILFDTYEKMDSDVKLWTDLFLARISLFSQVRVVIAGQQLPEFDKVGLKRFTQHFKLQGVPLEEDWLPYLQSQQRTTEDVEERKFLKLICGSCKGHPKEIAKIIDGLATTGEFA